MKRLIIASLLLFGSSALACEVPEACGLKEEKTNKSVNIDPEFAETSFEAQIRKEEKDIIITENKRRVCSKEALTIYNSLMDIDETLIAGAPRVKEVKDVEVLDHFIAKSQITYTWVNEYKMVSIRLNSLGEGSGNCTVDFMQVRRVGIN